MIEYGHDTQGGFYAIDKERKAAYYAYPSSDNADTFKNCILAERFLPELMLREKKASLSCGSYEERYQYLARQFSTKVRNVYRIA